HLRRMGCEEHSRELHRAGAHPHGFREAALGEPEDLREGREALSAAPHRRTGRNRGRGSVPRRARRVIPHRPDDRDRRRRNGELIAPPSAQLALRGTKKKSPTSWPAPLIDLNSGVCTNLLRAAATSTRLRMRLNSSGVERMPSLLSSSSRKARANTEFPPLPSSSTGRSPPDDSSRRERFGSLYWMYSFE